MFNILLRSYINILGYLYLKITFFLIYLSKCIIAFLGQGFNTLIIFNYIIKTVCSQYYKHLIIVCHYCS